MNNYRIYLRGTQVPVETDATYPHVHNAGNAIFRLEKEHPEWVGQLEARPDLDPITVTHGLPEEGK